MKEHMFDQSETTEGKDKSRVVMALSGLAVLLVAALIIIVASRPPAQMTEQEWPGPGSPEFDSYAPNIVISGIDRITNSTLLGRSQALIKFTLENKGDKVVKGLRIKASATGFGGETLAFRNATPVPRQKETLGPGETARVEIQIDPIPDPAKIQDITLQVTGLLLK
jgi:hypothetical protein